MCAHFISRAQRRRARGAPAQRLEVRLPLAPSIGSTASWALFSGGSTLGQSGDQQTCMQHACPASTVVTTSFLAPLVCSTGLAASVQQYSLNGVSISNAAAQSTGPLLQLLHSLAMRGKVAVFYHTRPPGTLAASAAAAGGSGSRRRHGPGGAGTQPPCDASAGSRQLVRRGCARFCAPTPPSAACQAGSRCWQPSRRTPCNAHSFMHLQRHKHTSAGAGGAHPL